MFEKLIYAGEDIIKGIKSKFCITGIYEIHSPSGGVYIGQSRDIYNRWKQYKYYKAITQPALNRSFLKYGIENHIFKIVCILPKNIDNDILDYHEIVYWDYYKFNNFKLLNLKQPGKGGELSEETKLKIGKSNSISLKGHKQSAITIQNRVISRKISIRDGKRAIYQYSLEGKFIKKWNCIVDAIIALNISIGNLYSCLNKKYGRKTAGGFKWEYVNKLVENNYVISNNKKKRPVNQYDLKNNFIKRWESAFEASKKLKINRGNIISNCRDVQKSAGGFIWKYVD